MMRSQFEIDIMTSSDSVATSGKFNIMTPCFVKTNYPLKKVCYKIIIHYFYVKKISS